jgi:fumarate hydratase class I
MTVIRRKISSPASPARCSTSATTIRWTTSPTWPRVRARAVARGQGRDGADPHQQPHVRRGPSPHLPGHRHRQRFLKIGMDVRFEGADGRPRRCRRWCDEGVRRAYLDPDNKLRASILPTPPARARTPKTTRPPSSTSSWSRATSRVTVAAKGGGSEAKSKFVMLNPSDSVVEWVLKTVPTMGAGWCPPGMLGIGIGGTAEKAMLLAKQSLMDPIDMQDLIARGPKTTAKSCASSSTTRSIALGIGAQGLGGLTTVLDVKVLDTPTTRPTCPSP